MLYGRVANGGEVTVDIDADDKVQLVFPDDAPVTPPVAQES